MLTSRNNQVTLSPSLPEIIYTPKLLNFLTLALDPTTRCITLEGTIRSIKTVSAVEAFHLLVQRQTCPLALMAAEDNDAIMDKLLRAERGLLTLWPDKYKLDKEEIGGFFVRAKTSHGEVKILLCGYSDKSKWEKILGKEIETIMIDEVNTADPQFVSEAFGRQSSTDHPVMIFTLNGDDPQHWVYQERINKSLIIGDCPASTKIEMDAAGFKKRGYYYTWWSFTDNPKLTDKQRTEIRHEFPRGSYYHKTRVLGERGKWGQLIYADYMSIPKNYRNLYINDPKSGKRVLDPKLGICKYAIGCDIAENKASNVYALGGFDDKHSNVYILDLMVFKSSGDSGTTGYVKKTQMLKAFLSKHQAIIPQIEYIAVDSAEGNYINDLKGQAPSMGLQSGRVIASYKATILKRINLNQLLFNKGNIVFDLSCLLGYQAYQSSTWTKGKEGAERDDPGNNQAVDIMDAIEYLETKYMAALSRGQIKGETGAAS